MPRPRRVDTPSRIGVPDVPYGFSPAGRMSAIPGFARILRGVYDGDDRQRRSARVLLAGIIAVLVLVFVVGAIVG